MDFPCAETIMNLMKNKPAKKRVGIVSKGAPARGKGKLNRCQPFHFEKFCIHAALGFLLILGSPVQFTLVLHQLKCLTRGGDIV